MLDDLNLIKQRDPQNALGLVGDQYEQVKFEPDIQNRPADVPAIEKIVITGMGGSALSALLAKVWLAKELKVPFEIVRTYDLPAYVDSKTLVIASSYSGNTEETLSALKQAVQKNALIAVTATGGKLADYAKQHADSVAYASFPKALQPRMAVFYSLQALVGLLAAYGLIDTSKNKEISAMSDWLQAESKKWSADVPTDQNYAKQIAMLAVGKTAMFYGGSLTAPLAYKWKISWNETAKNTAFWNEYPEFNHNEFMGWTSHPVEKPFAVFDLVSNLEHPQILKRFEISDRLLSGKRPAATTINLEGESLIKQLLWGSVLADHASVYLAVLNNVNPAPVDLVEKLKEELS